MGIVKLTKTHANGRVEELRMAINATHVYADRAGRLDEIGTRRPSVIFESGTAELVMTLNRDELVRLQGILNLIRHDIDHPDEPSATQFSVEARS